MTDRQYADLLDLHIAKYGRENQFIEFKSNHLDGRKLGQYLSALSNGAALCNEDYGYLYFGIDDDTLAIKGTSFDPSAETVKYHWCPVNSFKTLIATDIAKHKPHRGARIQATASAL